MKITIQFCSPVKVHRDEKDLAISKTIAAVERENGPSRFAVAAQNTKRRFAKSLRDIAKTIAEEEEA
jgi:hypothetical protein